ncbi:ABC transporter permease [Rhodocytophaga aerolata]|uniref:ABC transporter permease n=1 Tax=Rhodocytophaga aerolata TaxID=455078 RepID=A0ABT8R216_9BACT|nr:ABC transporter permease [Rhodocytophaga aerolata]MDO1445288.1 ABC transporter permease [Rhodocytophaga aerolata]
MTNQRPAPPPKWLDQLVEWLCADHLYEEVQGDLHERYYIRVQQLGGQKARSLYYKEVLAYLRPSIIKRNSIDNSPSFLQPDMLKHLFTIAYRNLLKRKSYAAINIIGLAVGITCCLLIAFYVQHELSYDGYHTNADRIYRVIHAFRNSQNGETLPPPTPEEYQVWGNAPVGPALAADFPEIEKVVQFTSHNSLLLQNGEKRFQEENLLFMDSTAFQVFSWKLLAGNPNTALVAPNSIVLTESTAKKYFGDTNPLGQTLRVENQVVFTVTGVMEDVPSNSHFTFNALISMTTFRQWRAEIFDWWGYVDFYTYLLVKPQTDIASLQAKVPAFLKRHNDNKGYTISFERLSDAYLHSVAGRQPGVTGNLSNVYIFSLIALFILVIACINFMNLSTARSMERAKEVGVRKVVGAQRSGLIKQFLAESLLLSVLATLFSWVLAKLALPFVEELSGKSFSSEILFTWEVLVLLLAGALIVGVLAGSYPAWVLSQFRPTQVLKGAFHSSNKGIALRKALVVFQFSLSMALIAGTGIVFSQLKHLRSHDLGFHKEQMLIINFGNDQGVQQKIDVIKNELLNHPSVISVSASRAVPGDFIPNAHTEIQSAEGAMLQNGPLLYEIDYDFIPTFGIEMAAGRPYSREFPADTAKSLILNEAAAKLYGYANPEEIIGKRFSQWGREGTVIGVVKDFNFRSLHQRVEPLALRFAPKSEGALGRLALRIKADNIHSTITALEKQWNQLSPQRPFLYSLMDESFNKQYQADLHFGRLFSVFSGLAILIACLGLFGLASFTAQQRTKEIGIRKVLGASGFSIVTLLSKDFIKLIGFAVLIATPVSWYVMNQWLDDFAYRITINPGIFAVAGLLAILIALLTVSWQAFKASRVNPVTSLKNE